MTGKGLFLVRGISIIIVASVLLSFSFMVHDSALSGSTGGTDDYDNTPDEMGAGADVYDNSTASEASRQIFDGGLPSGIGIGIFVIASSAVMVVLYARLSTDDVLEGLRKDIYEHISHNPGDHLAGITKHFGISSSSARHHLEVLEWSDLIVSHKTEKFRHYYPNRNGYRIYTNGQSYKEIMAALRNPTAREMVKYLVAGERANQREIANGLGLHPSTVNWHANRLITARVIARTREGKDIHYSLNRELDLVRVIALIEGDNIELVDSGPGIESASS